MDFSLKQLSFVKHSDAFINLAHGPVRSGKTFGNLYKLSEVAIKGPPGDFALVGKTERTAKRNIIYPLMDLVPGAVDYKEGSGELHLFGRRCYVVGANDVRAEQKVRGMTLAGAYVNEWTLIPKEVTDQLVDRCSIDGAQMFGDTNPDSPYHYLKKDYMDGDAMEAEDFKAWPFKLDDNPVLSEGYKARLRRIHSGLWLARMVDGKWVIAEGAVYPMFDAERHVVSRLPERYDKVVVGVDYGTATVTAFVMLGRHAGKWYVLGEHYHDAEETKRQKTDGQHADDFVRFLGKWHPTSIEIDPSAASFKEELRQRGVRRIKDADNSVVDGIRRVSEMLSADELVVHESCESLLEEMSLYVWDRKAQEQGEDKPVKKHDHALDALRYAVSRVSSAPNLAVVGVNPYAR